MTVLDASVKQTDETEPTQVKIISLTPPSSSWTVNIRITEITGKDYFLSVDRIGGNGLYRLSPDHGGWTEKPVTLEDVQKFREIIQLISQEKN